MRIKEKVELLKAKVGESVFGRKECRGITSIETLKKYGYIEKVHHRKVGELSLEQVVDLLNILSEDGYYESDENEWSEYRLINNKVCIVTHIYGYKFIK